ncbi:hypothetical protein [Kineosporia babensis]|uniref:Uncharacterized protein n=1 Tax=Kineosporia babensis TaxID=499548 RepID=A0A9X1NB23_9ACTN|nr:hypothetical protein [Kineosporia babensis]MCD5310820.1 hypothetical protein [Kineosporia babensis]
MSDNPRTTVTIEIRTLGKPARTIHASGCALPELSITDGVPSDVEGMTLRLWPHLPGGTLAVSHVIARDSIEEPTAIPNDDVDRMRACPHPTMRIESNAPPTCPDCGAVQAPAIWLDPESGLRL